MSNDTFRRAAVMGGFLSRAGEMGITPREAEYFLLKTAGLGIPALMGVEAASNLVPEVATAGLAGLVAPYYGGKAIGGAAGSAAHGYQRSLNRLDDPEAIKLKRRLIQILQMNRQVEGDLSVKNSDPEPQETPAPKRKSQGKNPAEFAD